jgi:hypothetical protein
MNTALPSVRVMPQVVVTAGNGPGRSVALLRDRPGRRGAGAEAKAIGGRLAAAYRQVECGGNLSHYRRIVFSAASAS